MKKRETEVSYGTARKPWQPTIIGALALIPLSRGMAATIDIDDLPIVGRFAWYVCQGDNTMYAMAQRGRKNIAMHRLISGAQKNWEVDHWDLDGLNNRRDNLRICTHGQNAAHRPSNSGKTHFKGAAFHRASGLYHATITVAGKQLSLGYFRTPEAAAAVYDVAAAAHFGAFAFTNKRAGVLV